MTFSEKLTILMRERGLSGAQLSHKLGVRSGTTVNNWCTGKSKPNVEEICKLSKFFGVSADYLVHPEEENRRPDFLAEDERSILVLYKALRISRDEGLRRLARGKPEEPTIDAPTYEEIRNQGGEKQQEWKQQDEGEKKRGNGEPKIRKRNGGE